MRVFCEHGHDRAEMLRDGESFVCAAGPCRLTIEESRVEALEDTVLPGMWFLSHPILVVSVNERGERQEVVTWAEAA
jgi:hypothetical protein